MNQKKICLIGGGITGISCAKLLSQKGFNVKVFEKSNQIGGLIACEYVEGNLFHKVGGHVFNSKNQKVNKWFWSYFSKEDEFYKAKRNASIYINNGFIGYPIELNLAKIKDKNLLRKIILELIDI